MVNAFIHLWKRAGLITFNNVVVSAVDGFGANQKDGNFDFSVSPKSGTEKRDRKIQNLKNIKKLTRWCHRRFPANKNMISPFANRTTR